MRFKTTCPSPLGDILVASDGKALTGLWFQGQKYCEAGRSHDGAVGRVHDGSVPLLRYTWRRRGELYLNRLPLSQAWPHFSPIA